MNASANALAPKEVRNGPGKYQLCAFISHMGSSPHSGHYVAHVKRDDGKWYIFNDEKASGREKITKQILHSGSDLAKSTKISGLSLHV